MPARWKHFDSGLLALRLPVDWTLEELAAGTILLRDPGKDLTLGLCVRSVERPRAVTGAGAAAGAGNAAVGDASLNKMTAAPAGRDACLAQARMDLLKFLEELPDVRAMGKPAILAGAFDATITLAAQQRVRAGISWLRRVLRRGPVIAWRLWAVENVHLSVLANCYGPPSAVEAYRKVLDQIIASIQLPDQPILVGRPFNETVAALAREYFPGVTIELADEHHIQFGACHVDLGMLHRRYLATPLRLAQHVKAFFADLQRLSKPGTHDSWAEIRSHVMPHLVETSRLALYDSHAMRDEWINGLWIVYVADEEGGHRAITAGECAAWDVDTDELHDQALANLVQRSTEVPLEGSRSDGYTTLAFTRNDPYNAARILVPDLHAKLRQHLGATFYVAIPSREALMAFTTSRPELLQRMRRQVAEDYRRAQNPVSPRLFQVTSDGVAGDPKEAEDSVI